ncbi:MAG TPA: hypothetical protein DEB40_06235 [Elusimicrobia bacterium]|nr:hypothetical protein [Elusimicrobiota bacterium]HBT61325.1 hypothetical protein [Elusimicrobiota bacterium]
MSQKEKIRIRGLARIAGSVFGAWGSVVTVKSFYDLFVGEPEANLYAPEKWAFVTRQEWLRYAGFELAYGLALLALAWFAWSYSRFLPEIMERSRQEPEFKLFD